MKKFLLVNFILGTIFAHSAFAFADTKDVVVSVRGMGTNQEVALKDALNQAVMQAAGAIVDSETLMKNDEIIQEKVLTASNAIVKKYDVTMPAKQRANGLWEIRIKAVVQQNLLRQTLVKHNIIKGSVEGTQNLWAEVVTGEKNQTDMKAMLENTLKKINIKQYLQFNLIGVNGKTGNEAKLYIQMMRDKKRVCVAAGIVCIFDAARFQKECMPHLQKIFDSLPFEHRHEFVCQVRPKTLQYTLPNCPRYGRYGRDIYYDIGHLPKKTIASLRVTPSFANNGYGQTRKAISEVHCKHQGYKIILNVSNKYRPGSQKFICYSLSNFRDKGFFNYNTAKKRIFGDLAVSLCLLDGDGNEVRRITLEIANLNFYGAGCIVSHHDTVISPEFFMKEGSWDDYNSPVIIQPVADIIDLEDLKDVKSFKLEITEGCNRELDSEKLRINRRK